MLVMTHPIVHLLLHAGRGAFLDLQEEARILYFDEGVHVLEAGFHESDLRFDGVVAEGN